MASKCTERCRPDQNWHVGHGLDLADYLSACNCDLDLLAHDDRATHAYGCPAFVPRLEA